MNGNRTGVYDVATEIDLKDLFVYLLLKIKSILIIMLLFAVAAVGLWKYDSVEVDSRAVSDEDIKKATASLTDDQVNQVEYIYAQYLSYIMYRKNLQEYLSDSLFSEKDYTGNICKNSLYFVESDIQNIDRVLALMALSNSEYETIAQILGRDKFMMDDVYRRVSVSSVRDYESEEHTVFLNIGETDRFPKTALSVRVIAETEEQADAVTDVVEQSIRNEIKLLQDTDSEIKITAVDSSYSSNIEEFISHRQNEMMAKLNGVNDAINSLQTNYIDKLDSKEKNYYEIINTRDALKDPSFKVDRPSLPKYIVLGAVIGVALSVFYYMLQYVIGSSVKTASEISLRYQIKKPSMVVRQRGKNRYRTAIAKLFMHSDLLNNNVQVPMIASDIGIILEKAGAKNVYIISDMDTELEKQISEELRDILDKQESADNIIIGDPLSDPEELKQFAKVDTAIIMMQLKQTLRSKVDKWVQLCERYDIRVADTITLEEV